MVGDVRTLTESFERYLRAANRSPRTVETYLEAVERFARFLDRHELSAKGRAHPPGARRGLHRGRAGPLEAVNRLQPLPVPAAVLQLPGRRGRAGGQPHGRLRKLLGDCASSAFEDRRDQALIGLLLDTGMRRGELLGMRAEDLDLDQHVALVTSTSERWPRRCRGCGPGLRWAVPSPR
ncbi:MAG: tyrosine-type recombinase/integrase [Actinomycetota bacterium]|nr:tyrosine-type recombinase/integrase [Actinomycetota bacterium]MDQ3679620.1 tyrosine-type recombinase/integrase [Actinomycetota bacterium]